MNKRFLGSLLLLLMVSISSFAQVRNVISLPQMAGKSETKILMPVNLENTDKIVGAQFDLQLPAEILLQDDYVESDRWTDHQAILKRINPTRYRVMIFSPSNQPFKGATGSIITLKAHITSSIEDGASFDISLIDPVLSDANGNNCITGFENGKISDIMTPDLAVSDVKVLSQSVAPGEYFDCNWVVSNEGRRESYSGWKENVIAVSEEGQREKLLATLYYDGSLAPGASVTREASVHLQNLPGISGNCKIKVEVSPYADFGEPASMKDNNVAISSKNVFIEKVLTLDFPYLLDEASNRKYKCYVTRSGNTSSAETIKISLEPQDSRFSLPSSIVIPEGMSAQMFEVEIKADGKYNEADSFVLTLSGTGYKDAEKHFTVIDDKYPEISVKPSATEVTEGENFEITISLPAPLKSDLSLYAVSDNQSKINLSSEVVIPAGETSVVIPLTVVDNNEAELDTKVKIRVTGNNLTPVECVVTVKDDDMPELALSLTPVSVSESAGPSAVIATLTRLSNTDKTVTIRLSEDSDGTVYIPKSTLKFAKGVREMQFSIDIIDNDAVDGDRTYEIVAEVYSSYCNCGVGELSGGYVSAPLTVTDDDVPHLLIAPDASAFLEGTDNNYITVTRVDDLKGSISVVISSDKDDQLDYDHNIMIPEGETSQKVKVKVADNDVTGDSGIISFKAEAPGLTPGSCWVIVTDQTIPDASIKLTLSDEEPYAGKIIDLTIEISNGGNAPLPAGAAVLVTCTGKDKLRLATDKETKVGEVTTLKVEGYGLPKKIGEIKLSASVNPDEKISELIYTNNNHTLDLYLPAAFTATATAEKKFYKQGETVKISGTTSNEAGRNVEVEVYMISNGSRQTLSASTDEKGAFETEYQLLPSQSGHFAVGACYPGAKLRDAQSEFDVVGLKVNGSYSKCDVTEGETFSGKFTVTNPSSVAQSNLKIEVPASLGDGEIKIKAPSSIAAGESADIEFTIEGKTVSSGNNYIKYPVRLLTDEGGVVDYNIYYYVLPRFATLSCSVKEIKTTVSIDTPRNYPLTLSNRGKGETGKISFSLPDWMSLATSTEIPSLNAGDSVTVMLKIIPDDDMTLNLKRSGQLAINCEKGDGIAIPFEITPVSETTGSLKIDVTDEFTYFTDEAPHVQNARVYLSLPSGDEVYSGYTNALGLCLATLNQGWYVLTVEADKHSTYQDNVLISPGSELELEAFLPYDPVTYSWEVVETEVEDEYIIETIVDFETRVPKPVIDITIPKEKPALYSVFPVILTNKGLIRAKNTELTIGISKGYKIEFLNDTYFDEIPAEESRVVYAKLLPEEEVYSTRSEETVEIVGCFEIHYGVGWEYDCETHTMRSYLTRSMSYRSDLCEPDRVDSADRFFGYGGGGGGGFFGSVGGGGGILDAISHTQGLAKPNKYCDGRNPNWGDPNSDTPGYDPASDPENDPVRRPLVSDDEPKKQDCDSKEEPVLVYRLIPVTGPRYRMAGVAADGVSQVKIVLDPEKSVIPEDDCENISDISWELSKDWGSIEGNSLREAIYTAPEIFPSKDEMLESFEAIVRYTQRTSASTSYGRRASVKINIIRPPVVFIHGLGDSQKCWKELDDYLVGDSYAEALYPYNINYRVDYKNTNTEAFEVNVPVVPLGIGRAKHRAFQQGFVATKCDIVGHSMGGILARLYVQDHNGEKAVNRIITVNTPHAGSELGDAVREHKPLLSNLARAFYSVMNMQIKTDINAVYDLAVESTAISHLNYGSGNRPANLPVYSIATQKNAFLTEITQVGLGPFLSQLGGAAMVMGPPGIILNVAAKYVDHIISDDWAQVGLGDLVVSTESQIGGCGRSSTIEDGPWHINSPKDSKVINEISSLLAATDNDRFGKTWYFPNPRTFEHDPWWLWMAGAAGNIALDFVTPLGGKMENGKYVNEKVQKYADKFVEAANKRNLKPYTSGDVFAGKMSSLGSFSGSMIKNAIKENKRVNGNTRSQTLNDGDETERIISIELFEADGFSNPLIATIFDEDNVSYNESYTAEIKVPSTFSGEAKILIFQYNEEDKSLYMEDYIALFDEPIATPVAISAEDVCVNIGESESLRLLCTWDDGSETYVEADSIEFENDEIAYYFGGDIVGLKTGWTNMAISYKGLTCNADVSVFPNETAAAEDKDDDDNSEAVCSTVTLSFKQRAVMTRQAFEGTFTLNNGYETSSLLDFRLNIEVTDEEGNPASRREFEIRNTAMTGFTGKMGLNESWKLLPKQDGTATIIFIPSKYAAPEEPKDYKFGGSFSYIDPNTGLTVVRKLNPVTLTVNPSPQLELTYFMQRDVFGDDPLTEEIEEVIPSEFALLINNIGNGDATNLKLATAQPEIISNEKGLAIDFRLVTTQLNGAEKTLMLEDETITDFGTIEAGKQAYAQWWLESSLLGHFVKYRVNATHVTSYDNPDLSLLDTVTVHELIHGFDLLENPPRRAFLVNDIEDEKDSPDIIYFTDGTTADVSLAANSAFIQQSDTEYLLQVSPSTQGWNYGNIIDPTAGRRKILAIRRNRDGEFLSLDNFWQTDRTMKDNRDPIKENLIHFVDRMSSGEETYLLTFSEAAEIELEVESFSGVPVEGEAITSPLESLIVVFNKPIDESTFTADDLALTCQGKNLKLDKVTIEKIDDYRYEIHFGDITKGFGFYKLTVRTSGITDNEGYNGRIGKSVTWIQNVADEGNVEYLTADKNEFKVYPVPMESTLFVDGNFYSIERFLIYDLKGTLKLSDTNLLPGDGVDVSGFAPGIYLIIAETDNGSYVRKVIKR